MIVALPGVGGIEAEAVMLGQAISMVLPKVVGYKLTGKIGALATSTDVVLTITKVQFVCSAMMYMYITSTQKWHTGHRCTRSLN